MNWKLLVASLRSHYQYGLLLILPLVLFGWPLVRGEALFWGLPVTQFVPWRVYAWRLLSSGYWPLWNPLNGMGAPLLANYQLALFYPPGWLQFLFMSVGGPPWLAWSALLVNAFHLSWAGIGLALFLRQLSVGIFGQMVGSLAFSMCGYFIARIGTSSMIWAGAWLPWLMLGGSQLMRWAKGSSQFPLLLIVSWTMQLLAGHAQIAWYSALLLAVWVFCLSLRARNLRVSTRAVTGLFLAGILSGGVAAVQLLPTAEYLAQSERFFKLDYQTAVTYSLWPWRFLTFFNPDFFGNPSDGNYWGYASYWEDAVYIGLVPFLLALCTMPYIFLKPKRTCEKPEKFHFTFYWFIVLVGALFALGYNTPIFPFLFDNIPTFSLFNAPARYLIWVEFGLVVLAGLAADRWSKPAGRWLRATRLAAVASAAVVIGALVTVVMLPEVRLSLVKSTAITGVFLLAFFILVLLQPVEPARLIRWRLLVLGFICVDLIACNWGLTPTIDKKFFRTDIPSTFFKPVANERIFINAEDETKLKFGRFFTFNDFQPNRDWEELRRVFLPNMNLMEGYSAVNNFDPLVTGRLAQIIRAFSEMDTDGRDAMLKWMNVSVYEILPDSTLYDAGFLQLEPWGRYRWNACAVLAENAAMALTMTSENLQSNLGYPERIVVEATSEQIDDRCGTLEKSAISITSQSPLSTSLEVHTDSEGYLVIADTYYPGWKIEVNGDEADIYRIDYLFYGTLLPRGMNQVRIYYSADIFYTGLLISVITVIILLLMFLINMRRLSNQDKV